jgi:hypothetical protein
MANDKYIFSIFGKINDQLSSANKASKSLLISLSLVSLFIFISVWNSSQYGWIDSRLKIHQNMLEHKEYLLDFEKPYSEDVKNNPSIKNQIDHLRIYYKKHNYDESLLYSNYNRFKDLEANNVLMINLPIVNKYMDVNDLSILGGLILFVLIYLFYYSLQLKKNILKAVFAFLEENSLIQDRNFLYLLALHQVLTVKVIRKIANEKTKGLKKQILLGYMVNILITLPLIVQFITIINDIFTFTLGNDINSFQVWIAFAIGILLFAGIYSLTNSCWKINRSIDAIWKENYSKIDINI